MPRSTWFRLVPLELLASPPPRLDIYSSVIQGKQTRTIHGGNNGLHASKKSKTETLEPIMTPKHPGALEGWVLLRA